MNLSQSRFLLNRTASRKLIPTRHTLLPATFCLLLTATFCLAENWPQWRGPRCDAVSRESGLPTEWSDSQNVVWKVPMPGIASATPVVWGDRIFLTSQAGNDLLLLCLGTDGKEQWRHKSGYELLAELVDSSHRALNVARQTPGRPQDL